VLSSNEASHLRPGDKIVVHIEEKVPMEVVHQTYGDALMAIDAQGEKWRIPYERIVRKVGA
jgi:hypothetical protein